jgi:hypothetical protein
MNPIPVQKIGIFIRHNYYREILEKRSRKGLIHKTNFVSLGIITMEEAFFQCIAVIRPNISRYQGAEKGKTSEFEKRRKQSRTHLPSTKAASHNNPGVFMARRK